MTVVQFSKSPNLKYEVSAKGGAGEIVIYGVVGDPAGGIVDARFKTDLRKLGNVSSIDIHINSPGGIVSEGRAIYNSLRAHPARKTVHVDGEASSIAALIAMAGDEIRMGEGSFMLIHRAWTGKLGNSLAFRKAADELDQFDRAQVETYQRKTKMSAEAILKLMDEDRYMSAAEAVKLGFADVAVTGMKMAAMAVDRSALGLPELPATRSKLTRSEARARMEVVLTTRTIKPARGAR